jgi:hypothetical protein
VSWPPYLPVPALTWLAVVAARTAGLTRVGTHGGTNLAGTPLIEKAEEDPQPALLDGKPGIWIKADVAWLVLWFNWKFEAWTPLRPDFCVQCHTPGGKRQI